MKKVRGITSLEDVLHLVVQLSLQILQTLPQQESEAGVVPRPDLAGRMPEHLDGSKLGEETTGALRIDRSTVFS